MAREFSYEQFTYDGSDPDDLVNGASRRWWTETHPEEIAAGITAVMESLYNNQQRRRAGLLLGARLYGGSSQAGPLGGSASALAQIQPSPGGMQQRVQFNVVQSCVDTITSKIAKNRPKPLFLTSGGDWQQRRRAKRLNQFVEGLFHEVRAYELGADAFRDCCTQDAGIIHVFEQRGRVAWERVHSAEVYVDEVEAFYGEPRQLHRAKNVAREVLLAGVRKWVSDKKELARAEAAVSDAPRAKIDEGAPYQNVADLVQVRESWHLPSGPSEADGLHVISVDGLALVVEPWEHDFFPFAFLRWSKRQFGFWGQSLAEQLAGIQFEINKLLWVIQRSFHLAGTYKVLMENTSKIVPEHLNNDIGAIIKYTGTEPKYITPPIVQPEIYTHYQQLKQSAYEQSGISQLSAKAEKPAGLNSGKALETFNDIETERFMTVGQAYERFYIELARISLAVLHDIAPRGGRYEVRSPGRDRAARVSWADAKLDEDDYILQCFPVSSLASDPSGRLQQINDLVANGVLNRRQGNKLMDFPDLQAEQSLVLAAEDALQRVLDDITDGVEYTPPEPYDDLVLARELALEVYARGRVSNLDPDRLDDLRRFIDQVDTLQNEAAAIGPVQTQATQPPPVPAPGAAPGQT